MHWIRYSCFNRYPFHRDNVNTRQALTFLHCIKTSGAKNTVGPFLQRHTVLAKLRLFIDARLLPFSCQFFWRSLFDSSAYSFPHVVLGSSFSESEHALVTKTNRRKQMFLFGNEMVGEAINNNIMYFSRANNI